MNQEDIQEWAEESRFDENELADIAGSIQVAQLMVQVCDGFSDETKENVDQIYDVIFSESDSDEELPEPFNDLTTRLALSEPIDQD